MFMSDHVQTVEASLERLIAANDIDVPMLPEVANKTLVLAQNPDSDASEMAKLIQGDQSLAGHVMRIANSVAYTPMTNLVSLQQAISRLGMGVISEVALAAAIGAKMFNTPGYEKYVAQQWRHALATALWAKEIARHCRSNVEVAFLAGLLHSIGRPAVLQTILDLAKQQQLELSHDDIELLENKYYKRVSEVVVNTWKLPLIVSEAIRYYSDYESATTAKNQAAQVYAGSQYATHMLEPEKIDKETLSKLPVLATLNLYQDEVEKLLARMDVVKGRLEGMSS